MIWNHFIGAETITYVKINWWNTSPNISISVISRRFPNSSITFNELFQLVHLLSCDSIERKKNPLAGYKIWLLHHTAGFVARGQGTLQLVECRLVCQSGNENLWERNLWMDVGMFKGRKIHVTGGRGYFGHKLRNELKKMGAVVELFVIFVF